MPKNPLKQITESRLMMQSDFEELLDGFGGTPKMARNLAAKSDQNRHRLRALQMDLYNSGIEEINSERDELLEEVHSDQREVAKIQVGIKTGRVSAKDGRQSVMQTLNRIEQARIKASTLKRRAEGLQSMIDTTPAEWEAERLARFPALRISLPRLTVEELL